MDDYKIDNTRSTIPWGLAHYMRKRGNLAESWSFFVVNKICADNNAYMEKRALEKKISERTGKSINTAKRWLSKLKSRGYIHQKDGVIITVSKKKLYKKHLCVRTGNIYVGNIYDFDEFKDKMENNDLTISIDAQVILRSSKEN